MRHEFLRYHFPISALLLATALTGCSSEAKRIEMPWSVPVASNTHSDFSNASDTTGSISSSSQVKSQVLPPVANANSSYKPSAPVYAPYAAKDVAKAEVPPKQFAEAKARSGEVFVESGDTLYAIARRNNVPVGKLMAANNISDANAVRAGQRLVLPGSHSVVSASRVEAAKPFAASAPRREPETVVARAETQAVDPVESPSKEKPVRVIPMTKPVEQSAEAPKAEEAPAQVAKIEESDVKEKAEVTASLPNPGPMNSTEFRWPVRGRVVENYGPLQGGGRNDGINIAVPTGTDIKAAENGVVAYAGSELKGYGKLILIRHDNDYVTAYAHNSDISVKRGDKVTRGQVIGKVGQTGNVAQPQLHFEIRKGSSPVDPMDHLSGM